ncbi:MAG: DUF2461 domain-containing protein [Chitinophagales bacterium]
MLSNDTLKFLKDLKKNNNKPWFEANRKRYEHAQSEIKDFITGWINTFGKKDPSIAQLDPKKCLFRIHRDVRFSTDKSPYKNNLGAYISKGGKSGSHAGYYLHIEPGNCFFGAGYYMPMPDDLQKIRQEIDYNFGDFKKIIHSKRFKETFGDLSTESKLKRAPKGYDEQNEAIEYIKLKGFTVFKKLDDDFFLSKDLVKTSTELCLLSKPFVDFLNAAID